MLIPILCIAVAATAANPTDPFNFKRQPITADQYRSNVERSRNNSMMLPRNRLATLSWYGKIGQPEQEFEFALATASVQTFVPKIGFPKGAEDAEYYDPAISTTKKFIDKNFKYTEGNITAKGETYEDILHFLQFTYPTRFGALTELDGIDVLHYDGQVGLAWKPYTDVKAGPSAPFIHSILEKTPQKLYQIFIKIHMASIRMGMEGVTYCQRYVKHQIPLLKGTDVPMLPVESFELGKFHYGSTHAAFLDISIGAMLLPDAPFREVIRTYRPKFDSSLGLYLVPCWAEEREWTLTIGGTEFQILDDHVVIDIRLGTGSCALFVEQSDRIDKQTYTLGMPFFYRHCVTFDVGNNRVGITKSVS